MRTEVSSTRHPANPHHTPGSLYKPACWSVSAAIGGCKSSIRSVSTWELEVILGNWFLSWAALHCLQLSSWSGLKEAHFLDPLRSGVGFCSWVFNNFPSATALVRSTIFPPSAIHPASFDACHMIYTQGQIIAQVEIIIVDRFLLTLWFSCQSTSTCPMTNKMAITIALACPSHLYVSNHLRIDGSRLAAAGGSRHNMSWAPGMFYCFPFTFRLLVTFFLLFF